MAYKVDNEQESSQRQATDTEGSSEQGDFTEFNEASTWSAPEKASRKGFPLRQKVKWHQRLVLWILCQGTCPRHVAFVPDGSRRYAKSEQVPLYEVYDKGLNLCTLFVDWMLRLNVSNVTSFILSIHNLTRSPAETNAVLKVMDEFWSRILRNIEAFRHSGLRLRCVGRIDALPKEFPQKTAQLELGTSGISEKATCSLCTAHDSKEILHRMAVNLAQSVNEGIIETQDITSELIDEYLTIEEASECDLWLRSSGEVRLSEFLPLQSGYAYLHFEPTLWPSFNFWDCVWAIIAFQLHWPSIVKIKKKHLQQHETGASEKDLAQMIRQQTFLRCIEMKRMKYVNSLSAPFHSVKK
ncbi:dehydrodolichyl diphosphate synthase complex subunit DHDDS-like [Amblyomma americanum]